MVLFTIVVFSCFLPVPTIAIRVEDILGYYEWTATFNVDNEVQEFPTLSGGVFSLRIFTRTLEHPNVFFIHGIIAYGNAFVVSLELRDEQTGSIGLLQKPYWTEYVCMWTENPSLCESNYNANQSFQKELIEPLLVGLTKIFLDSASSEGQFILEGTEGMIIATKADHKDPLRITK